MLPLLAGTPEPVIGGAEVQSYHLAAELARRGWKLSFLVCAFDTLPNPTRDTALGPAHVLYRRQIRKSLRVKLYEKRALFDAVRRTDAELVFQRAVWDADVAAVAARRRGSPYVYSLASDRDAVALPRWSRRRNVLRAASAIVAQSTLQQEWVRRYGRESTLLPSGFPLPPWDASGRDTVLWVGTLRALKRPEVFMDLAAALPDHRFVLCGGAGEDAQIARRVLERAAETPNLSFMGFVPYTAIHAHFARARVVVNTSTYEGFPNTFILAWLHGAVVLSLGVDPDGLLEKQGLGVVARDPEALRVALRDLLENEPRRAAIAARAREHAAGRHDIRTVATAYEALFERLLHR